MQDYEPDEYGLNTAYLERQIDKLEVELSKLEDENFDLRARVKELEKYEFLYKELNV